MYTKWVPEGAAEGGSKEEDDRGDTGGEYAAGSQKAGPKDQCQFPPR